MVARHPLLVPLLTQPDADLLRRRLVPRDRFAGDVQQVDGIAADRELAALHPGQVPLYSFEWELTDSLRKLQGPNVEDYLLAVAEAGKRHSLSELAKLDNAAVRPLLERSLRSLADCSA